jgi:3-oxoacyl-[acyl-carrier protein] reductase
MAERTRRVLVTGASRGIGRAVALELGAAGFHLALNFRSGADAAGEVQRAIGEAGGSAELLPFDVADRDAAASALEADIAERGPFWGVVLNAGITRDGPFAGLSAEAWDGVLGTNLGSFFNVLRPLLMPMVGLRDGGRVVVMSSVTARVGNPGQVNYGAAKAGLEGAVRSLALELARRRITVNAIAPGFIETDMLAGLERESLEARVPMRRLGRPDEVAALAAYLFGERAGYVTGQTFAIDGGLG